jgi:hypothetical protein
MRALHVVDDSTYGPPGNGMPPVDGQSDSPARPPLEVSGAAEEPHAKSRITVLNTAFIMGLLPAQVQNPFTHLFVAFIPAQAPPMGQFEQASIPANAETIALRDALLVGKVREQATRGNWHGGLKSAQSLSAEHAAGVFSSAHAASARLSQRPPEPPPPKPLVEGAPPDIPPLPSLPGAPELHATRTNIVPKKSTLMPTS